MRILFIGDIVGRPGKYACAVALPRLVQEHEIDVVIANAENAAAGSGITPQIFAKLRAQGVDACTLGDHIYKRRDIYALLETSDRVVKSANLPAEAAGSELMVVPTRGGGRLAVFSLLGRTFMNTRCDCPFHAADRVLSTLPDDVKVVLVDVHAETTSEKMALGWYLDGRVAAVVGTHTHCPTADERILPAGSAYITDVGMTGPYDSVLGRNRDNVIRALISGMPHPYDVATGDIRLCGVVIEADSRSGLAIRIERVCVPVDSPSGPDRDESEWQ